MERISLLFPPPLSMADLCDFLFDLCVVKKETAPKIIFQESGRKEHIVGKDN